MGRDHVWHTHPLHGEVQRGPWDQAWLPSSGNITSLEFYNQYNSPCSKYLQGTESPVGYGERIDRIRRMSGSGNMLFPSGLGPSRMSPGPAVSGSMERSSRRNTPSRNTPRWEHMSTITYLALHSGDTVTSYIDFHATY